MSESKVPVDPVENLARMKSILAGYEQKLKDKKQIRAHTEAKLVKLHASLETSTEVNETQKTIVRKFTYDINRLSSEIKTLEGKIIWAKRRQIPFIESEIERLSVEGNLELNSLE